MRGNMLVLQQNKASSSVTSSTTTPTVPNPLNTPSLRKESGNIKVYYILLIPVFTFVFSNRISSYVVYYISIHNTSLALH